MQKRFNPLNLENKHPFHGVFFILKVEKNFNIANI